MLHSINKYLHSKYVKQHGVMGVHITRDGIFWNKLDQEDNAIKEDPQAHGHSSFVDLPSLRSELTNIAKIALESKALMYISLDSSLCRFVVLPFKNIPKSKDDQARYIAWRDTKLFKMDMDEKPNTVFKYQVSSDKPDMKYLALSETNKETLDAIVGSNQGVQMQSLGPFANVLSKVNPTPFLKLEEVKRIYESNASMHNRCIVMFTELSFHIVLLKNEELVFYRTQNWSDDIDSSESYLKTDLVRLFETLCGKQYVEDLSLTLYAEELAPLDCNALSFDNVKLQTLIMDDFIAFENSASTIPFTALLVSMYGYTADGGV